MDSYSTWTAILGCSGTEFPSKIRRRHVGQGTSAWVSGAGGCSFLLWRDSSPSSQPVSICRMIYFPSHLHSFPVSSVSYLVLPCSFGSNETIRDPPLIILNFIPFLLSHWTSTRASPPVHNHSNLLFFLLCGFLPPPE